MAKRARGDYARLRATLGDDAFEAAYTRGRTLSRADAITLATSAASPVPQSHPPACRSRNESGRSWHCWSAGRPTPRSPQIGLFLSVNAVRSHLERIRDKTAARRRPDLVRYAIQPGIQAIALLPEGWTPGLLRSAPRQ